MILFVNGDSHSAAAEAVNSHAFAEDDGRYKHLGRLPHPDNLAVSWGRKLADIIKAGYHCDAESASSNSRILRTTKLWIEEHKNLISTTFFIIQWSTWEREEWLIDQIYYQVNASGVDDVPQSHQQRYKQWIADIDYHSVQRRAHEEIWDFHQYLENYGAKHIFFNGNSYFDPAIVGTEQNWGKNYIGPYDPKMTFNQWLLDHGHDTVSPKSWHFGRDAHSDWARFMLKYIVSNQML